MCVVEIYQLPEQKQEHTEHHHTKSIVSQRLGRFSSQWGWQSAWGELLSREQHQNEPEENITSLHTNEAPRPHHFEPPENFEDAPCVHSCLQTRVRGAAYPQLGQLHSGMQYGR